MSIGILAVAAVDLDPVLPLLDPKRFVFAIAFDLRARDGCHE
jgi:hypothetical protein